MTANRTLFTQYSEALFQTAKGQGKLDAIAPQAESLLAVLRGEAKLRTFLNAPNIGREDKEKVLAALLDGRFDRLLGNFVRLLVRRGRIELLAAALEEFHKNYLDFKGVAKAELITAVPLGDDQRSQLEQVLADFTQKTLHITYKVEPSLLAGVEFRSGDLLITNALVDAIDRLRHNLLAVKVY